MYVTGGDDNMDQATVLRYFIIAVLSYYLIKGILFLAMWQGLVKMEKKGKERIAKRKRELEELKIRRLGSQS